MSAPSNRVRDVTRPTVPFSEAPWISGLPTPYFGTKPIYPKLREWTRNWEAKHIAPYASKWEEAKEAPASFYQQAAKDGLLFPFALGIRIPQHFKDMVKDVSLPADIEAKDWDAFCDYIVIDELCRSGSACFMHLYAGISYGCGPIAHFASPELQARILPDVLSGKKRIALAITEPNAGSDVANLSCSAVKSEDGKHYIVNGVKKWITNGIYTEGGYLTTAVRTSGKPGDPSGISLLVVPVSKENGVSLKLMRMMGQTPSGTTFVEFDNTKVPVENLIGGKEGLGLKHIFNNFNHERMTITYNALRFARVCIEDTITHTTRRKAFGKPLIEQPVVRHKLAHMARQVEALQAWTEAVIYTQNNLTPAESNLYTGGTTGALKAHAGIVLENVCREAVNLLGGMGMTKGGAGDRIERVWRELKSLQVPGGAEDVLLDLSIRQALKIYSQPSKL
ncbi:hypothetical protein OC846_003744 [Tilletia horrida]|uniref:Acyl-CoA dehydrogenase n=1 Tax=Tilletia horrida TaxID=155126 RepID=A0AAN6GNJ9_9BASI|nr:hypothetical protein OC845_003590 [Tilletia horrida]KAK0550264.1 hypothetical protein OC846_003744 [Tilletia horrida]KAK0565408.1 hypothetical protein OC861_003778 [Tilletia horrida]